MRILIATGGSDTANRAVDLAAKPTAASDDGRLRIIHVVNVDSLPMEQLGEFSLREPASLADVLNVFAEEKLAAAKKRAEKLGVSTIEVEMPFGDVAASILESAREHNIDMIVVGRRGRGRFAGLFLGSVSQKNRYGRRLPCGGGPLGE